MSESVDTTNENNGPNVSPSSQDTPDPVRDFIYGFRLGDRFSYGCLDAQPKYCTGWARLQGWRVMGISAIGPDHLKRGALRQDSFAVRSSEGWIVAAVADGLGSAAYSHLGSSILVDTVTAETILTLLELEREYKDTPEPALRKDESPSQQSSNLTPPPSLEDQEELKKWEVKYAQWRQALHSSFYDDPLVNQRSRDEEQASRYVVGATVHFHDEWQEESTNLPETSMQDVTETNEAPGTVPISETGTVDATDFLHLVLPDHDPQPQSTPDSLPTTDSPPDSSAYQANDSVEPCWLDTAGEEKIRYALFQAIENSRNEVKRHVEIASKHSPIRKLPDLKFSETSATLLVVAIHLDTDSVIVAHIGDGAIAAHAPQENKTTLLGAPEQSTAGNAVYPVTRDDWQKYTDVKLFSSRETADWESILLMTDGITDEILGRKEITVPERLHGFASILSDALRSKSDGAACRGLLYLYTDYRIGSTDDRTLVFLSKATPSEHAEIGR